MTFFGLYYKVMQILGTAVYPKVSSTLSTSVWVLEIFQGVRK